MQRTTVLAAALIATLAACDSGFHPMDAGPADGMAHDAIVSDVGPRDMTLPDGGGPTDAGPADMSVVDGSDAGSCATMLDCTSGTRAAEMTAASRVSTWGDCSSGDGYDRDDALYTFRSGAAARMAVTITTTGNPVDYDLFAVHAGATACDASGTCASESRGGTGNETITFAADPSDAFVIGYDRFEATGAGPVTFGLTVTCSTLVCGDGVVVMGIEDCDDGNTTAGDGCDATCALEAGFGCTGAPSVCVRLCGNGLLDGSESCDDGNTTAGDGCDATCAIESGFVCSSGEPSHCAHPGCGNGILEGVEACDDGNTATGDGCDAACTIETGFVCSGAEPSHCAHPGCGNGIVESTEACDDGNTATGDGCSATCTVEAGFDCGFREPSVCTPLCGNGAYDPGEACDDGGRTSGNGCSSTCLLEATYGCTMPPPSTCAVPTCGNGTRTAGETCDDGNTTSGDGCSASCKDEAFTATPAAGASVMLTGSLVATLPTFDRPYADCTGPAGSVSNFQSFVIQNNTAATETLTLTAAWAAGMDGFLFTYEPPFDPTMSLSQCVVGDDDYMTDGSQIVGVVLQPGRQLVVVATSFNAADAIGAFTITVAAM